jgi:hypothetical protein
MGFLSSIGDIFKPSTEHTGTDELYPDWMQGDVKDLAQRLPELQTPQYFNRNTVSPMNPWMKRSIDQMGRWGAPGGQGDWMANRMLQRGNANMTAFGEGLGYLNEMRDRGPNQFQYDQGTFDTTMANLMPGTQNAFNVGARDIQQGYDFNVLPGLKMNEALGGGYGGSKALQQSALGQAMTAGNIQNMGVDLWQNAANQAQAGAMQGGLSNLSSANNFDSGLVNSYGQFGQMGANMIGDAYDMGIGNLGLTNQAGSQLQAYNQLQLDAAKDRWDYEQNAPWVDQAERQRLMQSWINPNAIAYGGSPFQTGLDAATGLAGLYMGMPGFGGTGGGGPNVDAIINGNSGYQWF